MSESIGSADSAEALIASLRKKTGQDRETRPGWSFDLAGDMLDAALRPDEPDPWTPEQRESGVKVEFVRLTLTDHKRAEGRAGERFARYGGNPFSSPMVLLEERTYVALWRIGGKVVPDNEVERDRVWEALGHEGRAVCIGQYIVATAANPKAREAAAERAADSFRVRA